MPYLVLSVVNDQSFHDRLVAELSAACIVFQAMDCESALGLMSKVSFDLIIVEQNLPGRDGLETLGEIQGRGFEGTVAFVVEDPRKNEPRDAIQLGARHVLLKRFVMQFTALVHDLRALVD